MDLFLQFSLLVAGLLLIWRTGEAAVRNAVAFSLVFRVEKFTIGFFLFAISTCLPEICAAVASSLQKVPQLSAGNLMGSTLVNVSLVLGMASLMTNKIKIEGSLKKKILRAMGLLLIILIGLSFAGKIHAFAGALLVLIFFGSIVCFQIGIPKKEAAKEIRELEQEMIKIEKRADLPPKMDVLIKLFVSLFLLIMSSWLTVYSSAKVADLLNVDLSMFGATLIGVGTSFTEFSLVFHSVKKKEYSLALGDIFGASVVNLTLALGILVMMNSGIELTYAIKILPFSLICMALVAFRILKHKPLMRKDGLVFVGSFFAYALWVLLPLFNE